MIRVGVGVLLSVMVYSYNDYSQGTRYRPGAQDGYSCEEGQKV